MMNQQLQQLAKDLAGELYLDDVMRTLYATDASAYREMPLAVAIPKDESDIEKLIAFARKNNSSLIPRTAGTSLAGQVVGKGIVVDVSRTFTKILEVNKEERWVRVQPGVVRDELNYFLKQHGLFFGPETSTANRAMIGGMVGNNSCGSNSVVYGSTRNHLLEVKGYLSDGSFVEFKSLSRDEFMKKLDPSDTTLESSIYKHIYEVLSNSDNQAEIRKEFPKMSIERRNTGYAIDELLETEIFTPQDNRETIKTPPLSGVAAGGAFNFCKLIAGSEGTLMFITEIKLHVNNLPPKVQGLVCVHVNSVDESLRANLIALKYKPTAVELIDHYILECTKENKEQRQNRFFVQGDPGAILVVELSHDNIDDIHQRAAEMEAEMRAAGLGYHFPILFGEDTKKIWTLRKAGLGLLSNLPGDEKAVAVIEDTAVDVNDLPDFIREFNEILSKNGMSSVHYAHAGSGEIHLRPIINLKTAEGHRQFRLIAEEISTLVKKYKGSLSGEHGDGRLRGEFIRQQIGEKNYTLIKDLKKVWDEQNIFNPNKIVDTPPMDKFLRYEADHQVPEFKTVFRFNNQNILQHAEQCNGSGDCRKTELSGGTMCPSYMATRNEKDTTRARANILREVLTNSEKLNRFDSKEIKEVMDLCLACKGCKSECPSNVDVAKLKMEFLQHYQEQNGVPLRSWLIGNYSKMSNLASYVPWAYNLIFDNAPLRKIANSVVGFHPERTMPLLSKHTLKQWYRKSEQNIAPKAKKVYLFCDEFTNYNDVEIGKKALDLLNKLGYEVIIPNHVDSGRAYLSKGMLKEAQKLANQNVSLLKNIINEEIPMVGIEPSAILTFRDEYPDLVEESLVEAAKQLGKNALMIDEFLAREVDAKRITAENFTTEKRLIKLHGHCQQKSVASLTPTKKILSLPKNYEVHLIPSGCCGMAGSFGYEKEHYKLSMQIGELVLFPTVRKQPEEVIIAAPGTSCRHQIHDGTGRTALHPVEVLWQALV
ncbi:FAD linked oxidase domain protein [Emticicia oligotrophica DSM 17448]|uniref:FAD linked oxidase domain protein n=1 Tax=Emticicia oligotrophica (strain DSM 17448 / CIP 109782 / MTCC 6937 / GPTSA100-15) TaxID=929562 RepID=A0ABM5N061_EMTOG|nr:FAD-binding and (Fe-S)-binding domain-containing protein [Emticicia oligotrophica]AFK02768.1 FAD linked oxidase domain protein [Emticicia oligotrophica DSM 17448]